MPSDGRIIFVSTSVTNLSNIAPAYLLYASAKGAIEQMTRVMAKDLARKGILVNAVAPGRTTTHLFLGGKSDQILKAVASNSPFNRIREPEEIAAAMIFLCGKDSSWMSGQVLRATNPLVMELWRDKTKCHNY